MVVADCAPGAVGCVESLMTFGPLKHDLRHCLVPPSTNVNFISPRDLIHIDAYDDEIYAKGCLKGQCAMTDFFCNDHSLDWRLRTLTFVETKRQIPNIHDLKCA